MKDSLDIAYNKIQELKDSGYTYLGYPVYDVSKRDLEKLNDIADKYGIPFGWLVNLIKHETASTFNPSIRNSIGASGLIQFMTRLYDRNKKVYVKMYYSKADGSEKVDTDELIKMSFYDQLDYVDGFLNKNLEKYLVNGKIPNHFSQGDIFMTIFYPVSVGKPDYVFPDSVSKANSGIRTPMDYVERALRKPIFDLDTLPYKLADVKKKFGEVFNEVTQEVTEFTKRNWMPIVFVLVGVVGLFYYLNKSKVIKLT